MTNGINNEVIDQLAQKFAETWSDQTFTQMFEHLRPMVYNEAIKAERDYGIPRETMISAYSEGIWQAARGDAMKDFNGSSHFSQRVHEFFSRRLADEIKYVSAAKRRGRIEHLDKPVPDRADRMTYAEMIPDSYSLEQDLAESDWLRESLEGFRRSNERFGLVIEMILHGNTKDEIAAELGSPAYDNRIRQIVKRARASFRVFLEKQKSLAYSG